jgi:hypothetical protein
MVTGRRSGVAALLALPAAAWVVLATDPPMGAGVVVYVAAWTLMMTAVTPGVVLPQGLIFKSGDLGTSKTFVVRDGLSHDHTGQYTGIGPYEYVSA